MYKVWLIIALLSCGSRGDELGGEVIVLYNSRMSESKDVALHYAEQRHVPSSQVFGFKLSTEENMTRAQFRDSLEKPLAAQLEAKKLWHIASQKIPGTNGKPGKVIWRVVQSRIRYAVLAYGMPLRILPDQSLKR